MTKEERTNIRVGLTALISIVLLLAGIAWAKHWHISSDEELLHASFPNAAGLESGDPVDINGVKVGVVQDINLGPTNVIVTMSLSKRLELRSDATASIAMLELVGGKKIDLRRGTSPPPFPANGIIPGTDAGDISSVVSMITSLSSELTSITGRTDTLFAALNGILQGDSLKTKLNRTLDAANGSFSHVDLAADRASALFVTDGPELARTLKSADSTMQLISGTIGENRIGLRVFIDSGARAVADARRSLARLDSLFAGGARHNSLLYQLTRDDQFALRVDSAIESLTKLSEQIRLQGIDANVRFWNSSKPVK